ncbi:diguanylate cyclase [Paracidovorax avenae ATCC 19860]|uniref:diguanylate cyclase n=1 Tax=Paracidovorax avenae (strain ATCC 19860 / DSM 7227 / CCUG 15838 / JCM 20985 / LMG 2117 / NCPPB 1011) TaxID=643561 RepID=F0QCI0_PARA1|nr:GGDEF domain-containing protein [Paracidovorax avenae]ADX47463.1 diguanylate cyclase [Paracidovorax avenae ATCC 19860]AVS66337.1 GGDEF domain-containing protein [Paracidovorax avenae]
MPGNDAPAIPALHPAPEGRLARKAFWVMTQRVTVMAAAVDAAFIPLFLLLGSPLLTWINVASIAMYAAAYALLGQRRNVAALSLIWLEVVGHSALGTWLVGWNSGFHYYLLMFIPAIVVGRGRRRITPVMLLALFVFYIGMYELSRRYGAQAPLGDLGLSVTHAFNVAVVFAMAAYTARYYYGSVLRAERRLEDQAATDPLTGLSNRRRLASLAQERIAQARQAGQPTAVVIADIDHFKRINDTHGHEAGDRVLVHVAELLARSSRARDLLARWGGEEFLVVMPTCALADAQALAERMRAAVADRPARHGALAIPASLSLGVAQLRSGESLEAAIARADGALYASKHAGRNRVTTAD